MASEEKKIDRLFRKYGYGFPQTEDEVNSFEEKFAKNYEKPNKWPDLIEIINAIENEKKVIKLSSQESNSVSNLAMAAREGKEISKRVREQMQKDKKDARKK